jgi:hypothetical protein
MKRLNKILGIAILVTIALSLMACGKIKISQKMK